ncbi:hypothetical protein AB0A91_34245 [Streptomyces sp. NPDC042207]|uniref:hypothetical protein n=1 Tax=Streptomyces sp. NPDC042207 TaxID=3154331 RepID=UPI0033E84ADF
MPSNPMGSWPVDTPLNLDAIETETDDDQGAMHVQRTKEEARRHFVQGSIREHLAEQPNPRAVRNCARRYKTLLDHLADDVIAAMKNTEIGQ